MNDYWIGAFLLLVRGLKTKKITKIMNVIIKQPFVYQKALILAFNTIFFRKKM